MQIIKYRLAVLSPSQHVVSQLSAYDPIVLGFESENFENSEIEILLIDIDSLGPKKIQSSLIEARLSGRIKKVVFLSHSNQAVISAIDYTHLAPDLLTTVEDFKSEQLVQMFTETQQTAQNNAYLLLANELNSEYEKIKKELEDRIYDKTKNLIESRRKVFETNSRIEFLRKVLYTISEIKTLDMAEEKLNQLLTVYNKVTWFKIILGPSSAAFELDLESQLDSNWFKTEVHVENKNYSLYFFKGDRKAFKKSDVLLFKKLSETLQINLARIDNLQELKRHENFFDLAFHSSKNPILVIDQNYQVHQANSAALQRNSTTPVQHHCYEMLFGRSDKCVGCTLGKDFQIQENNSFFNVHSQPLSLMEHEDNQYWVHVYEDSTEQNLYEKKLSQFARLEELGLISSSIAHELNNPLGGILSFIQIMKMELPQNHKLLTDLNLMHETGLRMKKIIEDLLIFSRTNQELVLEDIDIWQVTQLVLSQFELQYKVEKIKVVLTPMSEAISYKMSKTLFQDTLSLIFQLFLQKLQFCRAHKHNFISLVEVKITQDQINYYLSFSSNFGPLEDEFKTKDLNLLAIEKTLTDQGFQLFINEPAKDWIQLSVLFPKVIPTRS